MRIGRGGLPVVATVGRAAETGGWFMVGGAVCGKEAHYTCIHRMNLIPLFLTIGTKLENTFAIDFLRVEVP